MFDWIMFTLLIAQLLLLLMHNGSAQIIEELSPGEFLLSVPLFFIKMKRKRMLFMQIGYLLKRKWWFFLHILSVYRMMALAFKKILRFNLLIIMRIHNFLCNLNYLWPKVRHTWSDFLQTPQSITFKLNIDEILVTFLASHPF